mgnify:CR=1 FL=1
MFQQFPQQQFGQAPTASPLQNSVTQLVDNWGTQLVRSGVPQFQASTIIMTLKQYIPQICQQVAQQYQGSISSQVLAQIVNDYGTQVYQQYVQSQSNQQNFGGVGMNQSIGFTGGRSSIGHESLHQPSNQGFSTKPQNEQLFKPRTTPTQVKVDEPAFTSSVNRLDLVRSGNPEHKYATDEDRNTISLNTKCKSGDIVDVVHRLILTEDTGDEYLFNSVICYINEPSIGRVIENFIRTNPKLVKGKWATHINYSTFDLRAFKATRTCANIDLTPFDDVQNNDLPIDILIKEVVSSIHKRDHDIVKVLEELIVEKFNDKAKRFLRLGEDGQFQHFIQVEELDDIVSLPGMRDKDLGKLTFHRDYEATIFTCFMDSVKEIILKKSTPKGFYETSDIAPDLLAHPKFVVRDQGICEREMDLSTDFINAIQSRYTAFSKVGDILVTNFIPGEPGELAEDLDGNAICIEHLTNPIDMILSRLMTRHLPELIIMKQGHEHLIAKVGRTMDTGKLFIFKSGAVDLFAGER